MTPRNFENTETDIPAPPHSHTNVGLWIVACLGFLLAGTLGILQIKTTRMLNAVTSEVATMKKVDGQQQSTIDSLRNVIATNQQADAEWKAAMTRTAKVATETGEEAQRVAEELGTDVGSIRAQVNGMQSKQTSFITGDQAKVLVSTTVKPLSDAQGQAAAAASYNETRTDSLQSVVTELQAKNVQLEKKVRGSPAKKAMSVGTFLAAIAGIFFPK